MPSSAAMDASDVLAEEERHAGHGAIYTRREVVEFILNLAGYTSDKPLYKLRALEPSFGAGDFLIAMIRRIFVAWRTYDAGDEKDWKDLENALCAVELHRLTYEKTKSAVVKLLCEEGVSLERATLLTDTWLIRADFLLTPLPTVFDFVIGNPPYVRHERIPDALLHEYRARYKTMYARADLYIPFFERGLRQLCEKGKLFYICTDRWMKNQYGSVLREYIAPRYALTHYVDLTDQPAFDSDVVAYPAVVGLSRVPNAETRVAYPSTLAADELLALSDRLTAKTFASDREGQYAVEGVVSGRDPWLLDMPNEVALIRRIEAQYPALQDVGCRVGIGVATGADEVFIDDYHALDIEEDCKLPLLKTADIRSGRIEWQGLGVINPFLPSGGLVDLSTRPRLRRYLLQHEEAIVRRYCAKKNPAQWYRTIDRIHSDLVTQPKLLIPDIKNDAPIVYDPGSYYPHHNLYYIVSEFWDLQALKAVLSSDITLLFISAYSTKMRGGFLRYQAQYLRRLRLPCWNDVAVDIKEALVQAGQAGCRVAANQATMNLYQLSPRERSLLEDAF